MKIVYSLIFWSIIGFFILKFLGQTAVLILIAVLAFLGIIIIEGGKQKK